MNDIAFSMKIQTLEIVRHREHRSDTHMLRLCDTCLLARYHDVKKRFLLLFCNNFLCDVLMFYGVVSFFLQ